jgi:hypothetical protein
MPFTASAERPSPWISLNTSNVDPTSISLEATRGIVHSPNLSDRPDFLSGLYDGLTGNAVSLEFRPNLLFSRSVFETYDGYIGLAPKGTK